MRSYEYSFKDYALDILPNRIKMIDSMLKHSFKVKKLFSKGTGEKGVIKKIGRVDDFKGFYGFVKKGKVIYVGTSEKVINRLTYQVKGHTKYQAHLAWELAKEHNIWINSKFKIPDLDTAKEKIFKMDVFFMEVTSPIERYLLEPYAAMHYNCAFNSFES